MLKLGGGPSGLSRNPSGRIAFRSGCPHSFLSCLVPARRTGRVGPTVFGFKRTYCGVKNDPIPVRRMGFVCYGMNLVQHDVNMEVLLVFVGNDHVLVVLVPELVQRVDGGINPFFPRRMFSWRPCQFIVEDRIVAAWV